MRLQLGWLAWAASLAAALAVAAPLADAAPPAGQVDSSELTLPLEDGRLNLADVLDRVSDELGLPRTNALDRFDLSIDARSVLGRLQLRGFERLTRDVVRIDVEADRVTVRLDRDALRAGLAKTGQAAEQWMLEARGGARAQQKRAFGITFVTELSERAPLAELAGLPPPSRVVILVHGLDDPGFMWRDLIPALRAQGYTVARFEYPNDGPVPDAADFLALNLRELRSAGVERVDIVAHSMGGLVVRDVLTRAAYYNSDGAGGAAYPKVDRLLMLGTPNHGARLARFHVLGELREQIYRTWKGQASSPADDGRGEAGVDLLPGSLFLQRLNERPAPAHTCMTIIAGRITPIEGEDIGRWIERARRLSAAQRGPGPHWLGEFMGSDSERIASRLLTSAVDGLGDGCVTIDSARLEGVDDFTIVRGNHLSMIVNVGSAKATPPAIPIILDRLGEPHAEGEAGPDEERGSPGSGA